MSDNSKLNSFTLLLPDNPKGNDETAIHEKINKLTNLTLHICRNILKVLGAGKNPIDPDIVYSKSQIILRALIIINDDKGDKFPLNEFTSGGAIESFKSKYNETINRYKSAKLKGSGVLNISINDDLFINLNSIAYELSQLGVRFVALNDTPNRWEIQSVNPELLRALKPAKTNEIELNRVYFAGFNVTSTLPDKFLPGWKNEKLDVTVFTKADYPKFCCQLTFDQINEFRLGQSLISCRIRTKQSGLPEAIGVVKIFNK